MNGYPKNRRCTEKHRSTVEFYLHLAATLTAIRRLINEARTHYRCNHQLPDVLKEI
jgi:hypothetical protein